MFSSVCKISDLYKEMVLIAFGFESGDLVIWSMVTNSKFLQFFEHKSKIINIFDFGKGKLASIDLEGNVKLWNISNSVKPIFSTKHENCLYVNLIENDLILINSLELKIIDIKTNKIKQKQIFKYPILDAKFINNNQLLCAFEISNSDDSSLQIIDVLTFAVIKKFDTKLLFSKLLTFYDNYFITEAKEATKIYLWKFDSEKCISEFEKENEKITGLHSFFNTIGTPHLYFVTGSCVFTLFWNGEKFETEFDFRRQEADAVFESYYYKGMVHVLDVAKGFKEIDIRIH
jgi:WD40 repeat protein